MIGAEAGELTAEEPMGGGATGLKGGVATEDLGGVGAEEGGVMGGVAEPAGGALRVSMFL